MDGGKLYYMPYEWEAVYGADGRFERLKKVRARDESGRGFLPGLARWTLPVGPDNSSLLKDAWLNMSCGGGDATFKIWTFTTDRAGTEQASSRYISGNQEGKLVIRNDTRMLLDLRANVDQVAVEFVTPSVHIPISAGLEIDPK